MKNSTSSSTGSGLSRRAFMQRSGAALAVPFAAQIAAQIEEPQDAWEQTSDRQIRIGVVGGRFGLTFHWHEHPNCIVEAVSDLIPDRRNQLMGKYQCSKSYDSLEELVRDPAIDAVAVFTPAPDHVRHAKLCMEHGKHVIVACPACMTVEEAAELKEVKERTGLKYMSAETSTYRWETIFARELAANGAFGQLVYTEAEYYHPGIGAAGDSLSWSGDDRTWRYGFPPMLYPTHSTAFLVSVTGERLTEVSCIGWADVNEPAFRDNDYDNPFQNGMALFRTNHGFPFRCNVGWNIHGHGERAQWFGTKGALYMDGPAGQPFTMRHEGQPITALPDYWPRVPERMRYDSGHGRSHPFISHEFIMALVEEREPFIDVYESLAYCVPGIVAHASSFKDGEQLTIPQFEPAAAQHS